MRSISIKIAILIYCLLNLIASSNLIINHDFSNNQLSLGSYYDSTSIDGWICNSVCQLVQCHYPDSNANCSGNYLDLDVNYVYQKITQLINGSINGTHRLVIKYFNPPNNSQNKTLVVYFNSIIVRSISTTSSYNTLDVKIIDQDININIGPNNLTLTMFGGSPSIYGFFIKSVKLISFENSTAIENTTVVQNTTTNGTVNETSIVNTTTVENTTDNEYTATQIQTNGMTILLDNTFNNQFSKSIMKIPGGRVVFASFIMFFSALDRIQFYIFHNRNYSQNSLVFLQTIYASLQLQIDLLKDTVNKYKQWIVKSVDDFKTRFRFKEGQSNFIQMQIVQQRIEGFEDGFIQNQLDFLVYKIVSMCILFGILKLVFHALYHYPVSLILRRYYFYGTLFVLIIDGSIQELTFYLSMEITILCNYSPADKFTNSLMVIGMYIVMMASMGFFFLLFSYYKKFIKYLQQNSNGNLKGIIASTIDRGIACFLFGLAHRLLLGQPNIQLFVLMAIQALWITSRLILMRKKAYQSNILLMVWVAQGFLRIGLQISFYIYENQEENRQFINNFHQYYLQAYIYVMILQFLISSFYLLREILNNFKRIYHYSCKSKNSISNEYKSGQTSIKKNRQNEETKINQPKLKKVNFKNKQPSEEWKLFVKNLEESKKQKQNTINKTQIMNNNRKGLTRFDSPQEKAKTLSIKKRQLYTNHKQKSYERKEEASLVKTNQKQVKISPKVKQDALFIVRKNVQKKQQY